MSNFKGWEIIIILALLLLLFGAKRLPDAARGLGRSLRIFKAETKEPARRRRRPRAALRPGAAQRRPPGRPACCPGPSRTATRAPRRPPSSRRER